MKTYLLVCRQYFQEGGGVSNQIFIEFEMTDSAIDNMPLSLRMFFESVVGIYCADIFRRSLGRYHLSRKYSMCKIDFDEFIDRYHAHALESIAALGHA